MSFLPAGEAERREIEDWLDARLTHAMFPRNNLMHYGMAGGHPLAVRFWLSRRGGAIDGLVAQTEGGMVLPVALGSSGAEAVAAALVGREVRGLIGPAEAARPLAAALRLKGRVQIDDDEQHMALSLAGLRLPDGPGVIVPLAEAPRAQVLDWLEAYQTEALGTAPARAGAEALASYESYVGRGSHVVLMEGGEALAMTGFNARLPSMVQVGGVYTPPALRGRGHARRALGLHLAQVRAGGVGGAVLFASGPPAVRAYRALGFQTIGTWTMLLLAAPEVALG